MKKKKEQRVWDGHGSRGNNGMANKYVRSPYNPHHPRYISIGVETKYVNVAKEGAKGTTLTYKSVQTGTTPKKP